MNDPKFTPGPWMVAINEDSDLVWVEDAEVDTICDFYSRDRDKDGGISFNGFPNYKANAHLVAAAPAMYERLEITLGVLKIDGRFKVTVGKIEEILFHARGEE